MTTQFEKSGIAFSLGDQILVKQGGPEKDPYVAKLLRIFPNATTRGYDLRVQWYYRPEDVGRRVRGS